MPFNYLLNSVVFSGTGLATAAVVVNIVAASALAIFPLPDVFCRCGQGRAAPSASLCPAASPKAMTEWSSPVPGAASLPGRGRSSSLLPPGWRHPPSSSPAVSSPAAASRCSAAPSGRWLDARTPARPAGASNAATRYLHHQLRPGVLLHPPDLQAAMPRVAADSLQNPPSSSTRHTHASTTRSSLSAKRTPAPPGRRPSPPPPTRSGVGRTVPPRSS